MKSTSSHAKTDNSILDALDQALTSHENIFALAIQLEDSRSASDHPEDRVASHIGRIIAGETRMLKSALDELEKHCSQAPAGVRTQQRQRRKKR
jgi:hypothetical protein